MAEDKQAQTLYRLTFEAKSARFTMFFPHDREDILTQLARTQRGWSAAEVEGAICFAIPADYNSALPLEDLLAQVGGFEVTEPARCALDNLTNLPGLFEI
jgi:hypothetical protein